MKTVFIYNPASGSALSKTELKSLCEKYNLVIDKWLPINEKFTTELRLLMNRTIEVYVYGGDGTVNAVVNEIVGSDTILIPLPGGTLNHFTKDLGIPQVLEDAIRLQAKWKRRPIDVASVNGRYFINNSSIGVYARSLETRDVLSQKVAKWPAAAWATLKEIAQFRTYKIKDGGKWHRTPLVFVGNNHYSLSSNQLGVRSRLNKGTLSVYVTKTSSRLGMIRIGVEVLLGRRTDLVERKATEYTLHVKQKKVTVSIDGEKVCLNTPLRYRIHAGEIFVRTP
jgi:diacylglycerol kinase family enzyme